MLDEMIETTQPEPNDLSSFKPWLRPEENGTLIPNTSHTCIVCGDRPVHLRNGSAWMCKQCYNAAARESGNGQTPAGFEGITFVPHSEDAEEEERSLDPSWSFYTDDEINQMSSIKVSETLMLLDKRYSIRPPKNYDQMLEEDLKEWIREIATSDKLHRAVLKEQRQQIQKRYKNEYTISTRDGFKLNYITIADHIKEIYDIVSFKDDIRVYEEGIFTSNRNVIEEEIKRIARVVEYEGNISTAIREVTHYLITDYKDYPFNQYPDAIPVKNGVVQIDYAARTYTLLPHSPKYRFTYKLPVTFDPEAPGTAINEVFKAWIIPEGETEPRDHESKIELLYQVMAQALLQAQSRVTYKKAYLLKGQADSGKTTYAIELLNAFFGEEFISRISLHTMATNRFALAQLEGALLNVYDDLKSVKLGNLETFKTTTGGTKIWVERKGKDGYNIPVYATQVYTCNKPPAIPDQEKDDEAFFSRWEYIIFPNQFPRDPSFIGKVLTEENLSGLLNDVIKRMIMIRAGGNQLLSTSTGIQIQNLWLFESDPIYKFVQSNMIRDMDERYRKEELYNAYVRWCSDNGKVAARDTKFAESLYKFGFVSYRPSGKGKRDYFFKGYAFKEESPYKIEGEAQTSIS